MQLLQQRGEQIPVKKVDEGSCDVKGAAKTILPYFPPPQPLSCNTLGFGYALQPGAFKLWQAPHNAV